MESRCVDMETLKEIRDNLPDNVILNVDLTDYYGYSDDDGTNEEMRGEDA